ncbi:MAG: biopolymer transporter ExbD [Lamprobacter sp.]|uniref:ExbD/TolR family protein n=1 Tax=Lamprobacter sp. TaxID=3100796 RepID=UPI002B25C83E|nr:biopolymer transporter ExbD [Lamprobacter sp.]MEA3639390.1 biopolymer transporter ExbD [Lamprobacter sp.]
MRFTKPKARNSNDDALIPLINVVFLMLIFFMIAGQISPPEALLVDPPRSRQGQRTESEPILLLADAQGHIALDGELIVPAQLNGRLAARLASLRAAQEDADASGLGNSLGITLKADAAITHGQLRQLLEQLRALGVERLQLLSQPASN